ncbi:MAG: hypothetical protein EBE86_000940 [Hormoscilla sp. GUM202]|nr:hypothetical protein [Hormoscilla sp. GUM202]
MGGDGYGHDWLWGGSGSDWLWGGSGHDWLYGGDGIDVLYGQNGEDVLFGGNDSDRIYGGVSDTLLSILAKALVFRDLVRQRLLRHQILLLVLKPQCQW